MGRELVGQIRQGELPGAEAAPGHVQGRFAEVERAARLCPVAGAGAHQLRLGPGHESERSETVVLKASPSRKWICQSSGRVSVS